MGSHAPQMANASWKQLNANYHNDAISDLELSKRQQEK
jgi:hypothetical protein